MSHDTPAQVLTYEQLRALARLGPTARLATMVKWAERIGLRYQYDARGGIWTTVDALNVALGIRPDRDDDMIRVEDLF